MDPIKAKMVLKDRLRLIDHYFDDCKKYNDKTSVKMLYKHIGMAMGVYMCFSDVLDKDIKNEYADAIERATSV